MDEIRKIIDELKKASDAYYNKQPIMTDYEYNEKTKVLEKLEHDTGVIYPDSPTQTVGAPIKKQSSLAPVKHEYPAPSLDKTQEIEKYIGKLKRGSINHHSDDIILMWKLDGGTMQATYDNGHLIRLASRGDGETGYDITANAPYIKGLPMTISYKGKLTVRGEGIVTHAEYERINEETGGKYADERTLANSTISHVNGDILDREIWFGGFNLVAVDNKPDLFEERLLFMKNLGFSIVPYEIVPVDKLEEAMNRWTDHVAAFEFAVDGLVCALNNAKEADPLPDTNHNPNIMKGYAFKWEDETMETVLRKIEWSPSRTGLINPVAVFDSVNLLGTTVSRAAVHNVSILKGLHLRVGDRITVYKANMIIPQIAENLEGDHLLTDQEAAPSTCPCCGGRVEIINNDGVEMAYCPNPDCGAKKLGKFVNFANRKAMNLVGFSEKTIGKFIELGLIQKFSDFWHLDRFKNQITGLDGYGQKKYENLINAAENARNTEFVPFVTSLGIPGIGKGQAKVFHKAYGEDIMAFFNDIYSKHDFTVLDGIGTVLSNALQKWGNEFLQFIPFMDEPDFEKNFLFDLEIYHLLKEVRFPEIDAENETEQILTGKTFVITGKLNHYENRDALVAVIESLGGKASGSVSSKTSYLINNDVDSTSGKNKKAQELGIPVISENDFLKMIE